MSMEKEEGRTVRLALVGRQSQSTEESNLS